MIAPKISNRRNRVQQQPQPAQQQPQKQPEQITFVVPEPPVPVVKAAIIPTPTPTPVASPAKGRVIQIPTRIATPVAVIEPTIQPEPDFNENSADISQFSIKTLINSKFERGQLSTFEVDRKKKKEKEKQNVEETTVKR
jgi:hypothetical protein